jgi:hypothetical protein
MTREELDVFLSRVGASSLHQYLGVSPEQNPVSALEEKLRWAAWNFSDPKNGPEAEFVMTYASQIRSILDEGESTWRTRTERGDLKMREALQNRRNQEHVARDSWSALPAFLTPPVAPPREEANDKADTPPPPKETLSDEERINLLRAKLEALPIPPEDQTDPLVFEAHTLPEGARAETTYTPPGRVRRGVGPEVYDVPPDPGVATGAHSFVNWEHLEQSSDALPTDPGDPEPEPGPFDHDEHSDEITIPFVDVTDDEDITTATVPSGFRSRWPTAFALAMGAAVLLMAVAALAITMFELGRRHGAAEVQREVPTSTILPAEH